MKGKMLMSLTGKAYSLATKAAVKIGPKVPAILMVAGGVSIVTGVVLACKAARHMDEVLDEIKEDLDEVRAKKEETYEAESEYTDHDYKVDMTKGYCMAAWKMIKMFGPAAGCIVGGMFCMVKSYTILTKTCAVLLGQYNALNERFEKYRERVLNEKDGKDKDMYYMHGTGKKVKIKNDAVFEDGSEIHDELTAPIMTEDSIFSDNDLRFYLFDESNPNWKSIPFYNDTFLNTQYRYAKMRVSAREGRYITVNEMRESLGLQPIKDRDGNIAPDGFLWGYTNENQVDWGLNDIAKENVNEFKRGYNQSVIVEFKNLQYLPGYKRRAA